MIAQTSRAKSQFVFSIAQLALVRPVTNQNFVVHPALMISGDA
jgi:hypothetical protein